jgi:rare lipoprotein A (peptidoglycan hydrolase)
VSADAIDVQPTVASTLTVPPAPPTSDVTKTDTAHPAAIKAGGRPPSRPATTTPPVTAAKPRATPAVPTTVPPAPQPPAAPAPTQTGGASWYDYDPGQCAHLTIPKGTVVTITRLATGASTTCVVTDRGPHVAGQIIDLDRGTFAQVADPSAGVIQVRITW